MTRNQIAFKEAVETNRHNRAVEEETFRSNRAREAEITRSNVIQEIITRQQIANIKAQNAETARHNYVMEQETNRHNIAQENVNFLSSQVAGLQARASLRQAAVAERNVKLEEVYSPYRVRETEARTFNSWASGFKSAADILYRGIDTITGLFDNYGSKSNTGLFKGGNNYGKANKNRRTRK